MIFIGVISLIMAPMLIWFVLKVIMSKLYKVVDIVNTVSSGDLVGKEEDEVITTYRDEIGVIARSVRRLMLFLRDKMENLESSANKLEKYEEAQQINTVAGDLYSVVKVFKI